MRLLSPPASFTPSAASALTRYVFMVFAALRLFPFWKDSRNDPTKAVTFGDGTPLPPDAVAATEKVMDDIKVVFPWQKGDLVLIDNTTVQHARQTFTAPRRILAFLGV